MALSRFTTAFVETLRARTRLDEGFIEETRELAARDPATRGARPVPVPSVD
jgi:hypothetical protein